MEAPALWCVTSILLEYMVEEPPVLGRNSAGHNPEPLFAMGHT